MTLPDAGALLLMLAVAVAAFGAVAAPLGSRRGRPELVTAAHRAAYATAALLTLAVLVLERALLTHDFSLKFVAETTSRSMESSYLVSSLWGGQAGSLLFWCWALTLFTAVATWRARRHYPTLYPDSLGALLATQLFFLGVLALLSSPFERSALVPVDGRGLNPLLVDDGMRIHPPFLLAGYVSFAVPYAFAVAALAKGRMDGEFLRAVRRWTLVAWAVMGTGLLLGAWWAYHVLGWGGYWGWDPVENVALLPWLMATALLHSLMVQERRGMMKLWNVVLSLAGFCLAVFGTFVVRSGILSSVHAFAQSPLGPFFFGFLGVVVIGSLALVLNRLPELRAEGELDSLVSREATILLNNLLLVGVAAATLWGTVFPLISEALRGVKIAVGPQFYQQVNGPILLLLLFLLGMGPPLGWRRTSRKSLGRVFRWPAVAVVVAMVALVGLGLRHAPALLALGGCVLVVGTVAAELVRGTIARQRNGEDALTALTTLIARDRRRYGGYLVHLALAVLAVGVVGSTFFQEERVLTMKRGDSAQVGAYTLEFDGLYVYRETAFRAVYADVWLSGPGTRVELRPERRTYEGWDSQPTSGIAIHTTLPRLDDVYVLLSAFQEDGSAVFRVFVNPLVVLIWAGGAMMLLGVLVAGWPSTARVPRPALAPAPAREAVASGA
jgi:cytochrome c-type biogenesis protein CcmF